VTAYSKVPAAGAKQNAHAVQDSPITKENYKLLVIALDRAAERFSGNVKCRARASGACRM
jgi:hypothetical protein